jgi:hypothetical protein
MIDKDGKFVYSNIVPVNVDVKGNALTAIYPSPFTDKVNITVANEKATRTEVEIFDNAGKLVVKYARVVNQGINNITIENLGKLAPGVYIIKVKLDENVFTRKLIK